MVTMKPVGGWHMVQAEMRAVRTKEVTCDNERVRLKYILETLPRELSNGFDVVE